MSFISLKIYIQTPTSHKLDYLSTLHYHLQTQAAHSHIINMNIWIVVLLQNLNQ
jgi:hypothetical protein